jgi:peptidyl-prolyl cis-trans isomerase D
VVDQLLRMQVEERQIAEFRIAPEQFAAQVKIEDAAAVQKYYEENPKRFEVVEQARVEYVVLSLDGLLAQLAVSDPEVTAWYESHQERYQQAEERRASHILFLAGGDADPAKARAKAEEVLKAVQQSPDRFAELARQHSQDPGSAEKGGDLGFFARGAMVKPFEDTAFKLRENEISALVQSEFGYHIIKLTGIKPGKQRSLAEVRSEIEGELKRQSASRQFAESAEVFSNLVYEQPDSLQPAAEKFRLNVQQSGWLPRNPTSQALKSLGQVGNEKVVAAVFSDDSLKNKRNTEVVEVAPNTLLAARVIEHRPASTRPFEAVKAEIAAILKQQEEATLARAAGEARLRELQQGAEDKVSWALVRSVSRQDSPAVAAGRRQRQSSRPMCASCRPTSVLRSEGGNYITLQDHEGQPSGSLLTKATGARRSSESTARSSGQEDFAAYLAGLRQRYKIDINNAALESKER